MGVIKLVVGSMASYGASVIAANVIATFTPSNMNTVKKVCVVAGGAAMSGIAGIAAADYMENMVDGVVGLVDSIKDKFEK